MRRQSRLVVDEKLSIREAIDLAKSTGKRIVLRNGSSVEPTDPVTLQELVNRVKAKGTQPVSLRLPVADLEAAKKIAEKTGIGYQTVLKELIHEALQRVS